MAHNDMERVTVTQEEQLTCLSTPRRYRYFCLYATLNSVVLPSDFLRGPSHTFSPLYRIASGADLEGITLARSARVDFWVEAEPSDARGSGSSLNGAASADGGLTSGGGVTDVPSSGSSVSGDAVAIRSGVGGGVRAKGGLGIG